MTEIAKERIACLIIEMLFKRYNEISHLFSSDKVTVFQNAFLKNFIELDNNDNIKQKKNSLESILFNNIVGQSFFERTAQILCDGEKRRFKNLFINDAQQTSVNEIISSLKNNSSKPNLKLENELIFSELGKASNSIPNFDADVYYEDENDIVVIEIKTVKPNSGIFKVEKEKILLAKAALKNIHPGKNVYYYLAFPFDPLNENKCGYDKERFFNYSIDFKKFFDGAEVLLADEFWDFLSGEKETMQEILRVINSISMPDFMSNFNLINDSNNTISDSKKYTKLLKEWFLSRELKFIENKYTIEELSKKNKKLTKLLNQNLFDIEGKYKDDRINLLLQSLSIA